MQECFSETATQPGETHECFGPLLQSNTELASVVRTKLSTVMQIILLRPKDPAPYEGALIVTNTHLFFHPGASHIRIMQAGAIMVGARYSILRYIVGVVCDHLCSLDFQNEVSKAAAEWSVDGEHLGLLVCGDLNSEPDTGAIELLAKGHVSRDHMEWREFAGFSWDGQQAEEDGGVGGSDTAEGGGVATKLGCGDGVNGPVVGIDLSHPWELASACGLKTSFTNYVRGYIGCLDYVLYQSTQLRLSGLAPLPTESEVQDTALPSGRFPSDHISLCYDFEWIHPGDAAGLAIPQVMLFKIIKSEYFHCVHLYTLMLLSLIRGRGILLA